MDSKNNEEDTITRLYKKTEEFRKKDIKIKAIAISSILIVGVSVGAMAKKSFERFEGKSQIISEFYDATSEYDIRNDSQSGYIINKGNCRIDFDDAIVSMKNDALDAGMSYDEVAIAIGDEFTKEDAKKSVGYYPSYEERKEIYEKSYYESKVEEYGMGVTK